MNYAKSELEKAYYSAFEANGKYIDVYGFGSPMIEEIITKLYQLRWNLVPKDEFEPYFVSNLIISFDNAISSAFQQLVMDAEGMETKGTKEVSEDWIYKTLEKQKEVHKMLVAGRVHLTVYNTITKFNEEINKEN